MVRTDAIASRMTGVVSSERKAGLVQTKVTVFLIRYMLQPTLFPAGKPAPGGAKGVKFATCGGCVPRLGPVPGCSPEVAEVHD